MNNSAYTPNSGVTAPIDPGWNDPPKLAYNPQTTPNRPRNILNKRVAFPLSNTATSPVVVPAGNMPPMPAVFSPPPLVPLVPSIEQEEIVDSENTLKEVKGILYELLDTSSELGNKANDIRRRIDVMETMWSSGKLNNSVYFQMRNLAYALRDSKPSKADDIHRALMIDHVSAVGTWMPGIKQLIHHYIARTELLSIDQEE
ncbi:steroid receptor RNA activator 1 [Anticarsia gemmatalis]|uniref:steroid receptor RNA activator 1 n=1 Tax=Anticarsia gemmatalis TaxID=129554 RepID=UPI003F757741